MIKSLCGSFCSACLHPLTRRYKALLNLVQVPTYIVDLHLGSTASIIAMASIEARAVQVKACANKPFVVCAITHQCSAIGSPQALCVRPVVSGILNPNSNR